MNYYTSYVHTEYRYVHEHIMILEKIAISNATTCTLYNRVYVLTNKYMFGSIFFAYVQQNVSAITHIELIYFLNAATYPKVKDDGIR